MHFDFPEHAGTFKRRKDLLVVAEAQVFDIGTMFLHHLVPDSDSAQQESKNLSPRSAPRRAGPLCHQSPQIACLPNVPGPESYTLGKHTMIVDLRCLASLSCGRSVWLAAAQSRVHFAGWPGSAGQQRYQPQLNSQPSIDSALMSSCISRMHPSVSSIRASCKRRSH